MHKRKHTLFLESLLKREEVIVLVHEGMETFDSVGDQVQTAKTLKCTFSGIIPIEAERFLGGTHLVECPDCATMRSVKPHNGVLRLKSHDKRKTKTPNTEQRWVRGETGWDVIGG